MSQFYNLFCPPVWNDWSQGENLALGTLTFYSSLDHSIKKPVYKDPNGSLAWDNPLTLNSYGQSTGPIYGVYDDTLPDEKYYLVIKDSTGATVRTIDNYLPALTEFEVNSSAFSVKNLIRNPQFSIWDHVPVNVTGGTTIVTSNLAPTTFEGICDDWYIYKDAALGSQGTDSVQRMSFTADQNLVPYNPEFYLRYNCTAAGSSTVKYIAQRFKSAIFLAGQTVSIAFYAKADQTRTLKVFWMQNFGTGGSPSATVVEQLTQFSVNTSWNRYTTDTVGVTIPAATSKTIGSNYDDYSYLIFSFETGNSFTYDLCNVQLTVGNVVPDFQQDSIENERAKLDIPYRVPTGKSDLVLVNWYQAPTQSLPASYEGYFAMNDGNIANPSVAGPGIRKLAAFNLYCFIWNNFDDTACPVSGGTRGANAVADYNAGKTIALPKIMGRMPIGIGAGSGLTARNPGYTGGSETHTQTGAEVGPHSHGLTPYSTLSDNEGGGLSALVFRTNGGSSAGTETTTTSPAASAMDIMNPFVGLPFYIHQ